LEDRIVNSFKRSDVPSELLVSPNLKKLFIDLGIDWLVLITSSFLMFHTPFYLYPVWAMIIAGRLHAFGVILHDLSHLNLKHKTWSMRLLEVLSGYPIGTTANAMAYHHIRHHRNTLMLNDPYFNINKKCTGVQRFFLTFKKGLFFVPFWIFRSFYGSFAYFVPQMRNSYARIFLQDVSKKDLTRDNEVIDCAREEMPLAIFHTILLSQAFIFPQLIYTYYLVIPVAGVMCIYRLLIEHEYDIYPDKNVYTLIESTFDHHHSLWGKLFFSPRNIGYHCMHHIHPNVGLHGLPQLKKWYLTNCEIYREKYESGQKI